MSTEQPAPPKRLNKLYEQRAQLAARIKLLEAREKSRSRKDDARRKIIAGALALEHAILNPDTEFGKKLFRLLDEYVITDRERALFDMAPLAKAPANDQPSSDSLTGKFPR